MEGQAVVEAFFGEEDEGVDGLRRPLGVERDREVAAARLDLRRELFALLDRLLGRLEADVLGLRAATFSQPAAPADFESRRRRRCGRSGSPPTTIAATTREAGEDDPAAVRAPPGASLHRRQPRGSRVRDWPAHDRAVARGRSADPRLPWRRRSLSRSGWRREPERVARGRVRRRATGRPLPRPRVPARPGARRRRSPSEAIARGDGAGSASTPRAGSPSRSATPRALPFPDDHFDLVVQRAGRLRSREVGPGPAPGRPCSSSSGERAGDPSALPAPALGRRLRRHGFEPSQRGRGRRRQFFRHARCAGPARARAPIRLLADGEQRASRRRARSCRWRSWSTRPRAAAGR